MVEDGVSNKNVPLIWSFNLGSNDSLVLVVFFRQRPGEMSRTQIASREGNTAFGFPKGTDFNKHYLPKLNSELVLLDVNKKEEYIYSLQVFYKPGSHPFEVEFSQVSVIVRGE